MQMVSEISKCITRRNAKKMPGHTRKKRQMSISRGYMNTRENGWVPNYISCHLVPDNRYA